MDREQLIERSPMRHFEAWLGGGLGRGRVGVVAGRAGVGKTALLVHIALDSLMAGKRVLHVSYDHPVGRVRAYYDELWARTARPLGSEQPEELRHQLERRRLILSRLSRRPADVEEAVTFARDAARLAPDVVIVEGLDPAGARADDRARLRALAAVHDAELWLAERTEAADPTVDPLDAVVRLSARGNRVDIRIETAPAPPRGDPPELQLVPSSLEVVSVGQSAPARGAAADAAAFHLYSGGARGAEAEFGACAEAWGVAETNFTFDGHHARERGRGVVTLDDEELRKGDFSIAYASRRLRRDLGKIPCVRRILQTLWHQISAANEVFVVGALQDDDTVRGGTGWGAELARLWDKPLHLFDQQDGRWYRWDASAWQREEAPRIARSAFAGIGTTKLTDEGREAIRQLFERSFGER